MTFKDAVLKTPSPVNRAYKKGKQALENKHRKLVNCNGPGQITGSLALDSALKQEPTYANQPRWDYGLGYKPQNGQEQAVWIEVHSAHTNKVSTVLEKLQWLEDWLNAHASQLNQLTQSGNSRIRYVWIASKGVHITPNRQDN